MYRFFLALVCASFGCGPALTARETCLNANTMRRPSERRPCPIERVVGVEYAGAASTKPSWTCATIGGFYIRQKDGTLSAHVEIFRGEGTGFPKNDAIGTAQWDMTRHMSSYAAAHGLVDDYETFVPEPRTAMTRDQRRRSSGLYHRCWYRGHAPHPDVATWPAATWPRRATIKDVATGKQITVPAALAWSPGQERLDPRFCRQWDRVLESFGAIPVASDTGAVRWDCPLTLTYRPFVETSTGKELGSPITISLSARDLCGPATNARSGTEAALRKQAGPNLHIVEYGGECVAVKP